MVAFRAKVDGTWQAKFQRRLRYLVTRLRPNLPFSLVLPFPPLSSTSPIFPTLSPIFSLFTLFSLPFFFFLFFPHFSSTFPSPSPTFSFFPAFLAKVTRLHVTPLSAMCSTRHRILRRTRHVVKEDFCLILGIFRNIQKKGSKLREKHTKRRF